MRGMFTAGILDAFMQEDIRFDGTIGVSAGAAFGVNFKTGQIGRAIRYNMRYCRDKRYCGLWALLRDGNIYSRDFAYEQVPLKLDKFDFAAYSRNPMPFYVVATDVETGEPVYHEYGGREDHTFEWIRASSSMPLVSQFVEIEGHKLLDGGISDSIPLRYFESLGYNRNVVILTQPPMYEKKENGLLFAVRLLYRKYPHLVKAMQERHLRYNETLRYIEEKERSGEILVIRPEAPLPVSRVEKDPLRLKEAYDIGLQTGFRRMAEVKAFLGIKPAAVSDVPYKVLQGVYSRVLGDRDAIEYWFSFENGCLHLKTNDRFEHCEAVPAQVSELPFTAAEDGSLHYSFRGSNPEGIYDDGDGSYMLRFDNGNIIEAMLSPDPRGISFYRDLLCHTAEKIATERAAGRWNPDYERSVFAERNRVPVYAAR